MSAKSRIAKLEKDAQAAQARRGGFVYPAHVYILFGDEQRVECDGATMDWQEYQEKMARDGGAVLPDNGRGEA